MKTPSISTYVKSSALLAALFCALALSCADDPGDPLPPSPEVGGFLKMFEALGKQYTLTIVPYPRNGGDVVRNPSAGNTTYKAGAKVTLTAIPADGYKFSNWTGAANDTSSTVTVVMNGDLTLTANFASTAVSRYSLVVNADPSQGFVTRTPNSLSGSYAEGDTVTVKASARKDYKFTGWSGSSNDTTESVVIVMAGNTVLTANFIEERLNAYALRLRSEPNGAGDMTRTPDRGLYYADGAWVDVLAEPAAGYEFVRWSGAAESADNPLRIQMTGDKTLTAVFRTR